MPGWISAGEKLERLKHVSTVVLPSYNEGLPISILEGMAAGKAIVTTAVGAIPEVIADENGILVEPGNISALAKGLLRCSGDSEMLRSMSIKNREKAKNIYNIQKMHEKLAEYYRQVMKE